MQESKKKDYLVIVTKKSPPPPPQQKKKKMKKMKAYFIFTVPCIITILIRSNKMQQNAGIYLLQDYSTCFRCPSHPSSGEHKTVTAASGTGHIT